MFCYTEPMYENFYSLAQKPFSITSNPSFLFMGARHKEALAHLIYGIRERVGFIQITGEIGAGKTTLCRALLNQLGEDARTAFVFNPNVSEIQLLQTIVEDFGIDTAAKSKGALLAELNRFLIRQLSEGKNAVLIIDEAQNMSVRLLEQVRMLSNLEADNEKLIQIVLVGQPELREKLEAPELRQLRQRISVRYHIGALSRDEVPLYVNHRLDSAGANGRGPQFDDRAFDAVFDYSRGIPRLINVLCNKALLTGFVLEERGITEEMVRQSIREIEGELVHEHHS